MARRRACTSTLTSFVVRSSWSRGLDLGASAAAPSRAAGRAGGKTTTDRTSSTGMSTSANGSTSNSSSIKSGGTDSSSSSSGITSTDSSMASLKAQLEKETCVGLREKAKRANIRGRSTMRKHALVTALLSHHAQAGSSPLAADSKEVPRLHCGATPDLTPAGAPRPDQTAEASSGSDACCEIVSSQRMQPDSETTPSLYDMEEEKLQAAFMRAIDSDVVARMIVAAPMRTDLVGVRYIGPHVSLNPESKIHVFHDLDNLNSRHVSPQRLVSALRSVLQPLGKVAMISAYGNPYTLRRKKRRKGQMRPKLRKRWKTKGGRELPSDPPELLFDRDGLAGELNKAGVKVYRLGPQKNAVDDAIRRAVNKAIREAGPESPCDAVCIISNDNDFVKVLKSVSSRGVCSIAVWNGGVKLTPRHPTADVTIDFRVVEDLARQE